MLFKLFLSVYYVAAEATIETEERTELGLLASAAVFSAGP